MGQSEQKFIIRRTVLLAVSLLIIVVTCSYLFSRHPGVWDASPTASQATPEQVHTQESTEESPPSPTTNKTLPFSLALVNAGHPIGNTVPEGLINIYNTYGSATTPLRDIYVEMNEEAYLHCREMFQAAKSQGIRGVYILSAYRPYEKQVTLYQEYLQQGGANDPYPQVSKAGESEHQLGLAMDLAISAATLDTQATNDFAKTSQGQWFMEHCWEYGFILRFPADKQDITGIAYESWHFRYVGVEHAMAMKNMNLCLEEYVAYLVQ